MSEGRYVHLGVPERGGPSQKEPEADIDPELESALMSVGRTCAMF